MKKLNLLIKKELDILDKEINNLFKKSNIVYNDLNIFLNSSNKRIRSLVIILYLKTIGIDITTNIFDILLVGELIHNASLLHDDVIDNAEFRRGEKTLWKKYSSKISIILGDYLLSLATQKTASFNNPKITNLFINCLKNMCEGEIKQFLLRGDLPNFDDYIEICYKKTALLFKTIFEACMLNENISFSHEIIFFEKFGLLFQLKNDIEQISAQQDKLNNIYTINNICGIEKSKELIDNYQRELIESIQNLPNNIYRDGLEELINKL